MRSIFGSLFGRDAQAEQDSETIRRIATELDKLEPERARFLAAFAFVLSRVAHADQEASAGEVATMERLVEQRGELPHEQAVLVVQMARTQQRLFGGTDDFLVTRQIGREATYEQKLALIDCLYAVAAADRSVGVLEANEIARIGRELRVEQSDLSRLRNTYRDFLAAREGLGE
jgi:uncharacterized tellurite resistance protein B-like protein